MQHLQLSIHTWWLPWETLEMMVRIPFIKKKFGSTKNNTPKSSVVKLSFVMVKDNFVIDYLGFFQLTKKLLRSLSISWKKMIIHQGLLFCLFFSCDEKSVMIIWLYRQSHWAIPSNVISTSIGHFQWLVKWNLALFLC